MYLWDVYLFCISQPRMCQRKKKNIHSCTMLIGSGCHCRYGWKNQAGAHSRADGTTYCWLYFKSVYITHGTCTIFVELDRVVEKK